MKFELILKSLPNFIQNLLISIFNNNQYRLRHGGKYHSFKKEIKDFEKLDNEKIKEIQNKKFIEFLNYLREKSPYYKNKIGDLDISKGIQMLSSLPIISKEEFNRNIDSIITEPKKNMVSSKTGGTTGISMQVYFNKEDVQERFALLDNFRERFGYEFGKKTAWLSGKDLLNKTDLKKNRYWKTDFINNIRFYSTFQINNEAIPYYIADLNKFKPEFIVGFPSSIVEIARYGIKNNLNLDFKVKAVFPTAETKKEDEVEDILKFFGANSYDQYASSEGACFITECQKGNMHFEPLSGIIEVVDENDNPAKEGRMLITAFHTKGTPLLRYDIGDTMAWSDEASCECGLKTPLVEKLNGRVNDFIYSEQTGKSNLGNISNCVKYVKGIDKFQIVQNKLDEINVFIKKTSEYSKKDEEFFIGELRARLGDKIKINIEYVPDIPREKSGKFRIVKNNLDFSEITI